MPDPPAKTTMAQSRETRVLKRSNNQSRETGKRRAPYVLRACGACRRRKGKCDGRQPCRRCADRGQSCSYSTGFESDRADDWQALSTSAVNNVDPVQSNERRETRRANSSISCNPEAIAETISTLQDQLDNLASQVQMANRDQSDPPSPVSMTDAANPRDSIATLSNDTGTGRHDLNTAQKASRAAASQSFYGPTSPDYALNVGQLKLRQDRCPGPPLQEYQLQLASIDEEDASDAGDANDTQNPRFSVSPRTLDGEDLAPLLNFRSVMGLQEAIQLLHTYQEVVGDLHPVVDIDALIQQTRSWYADADSAAWDTSASSTGAISYELLLILNLALAIALRADSGPTNCNTENILRDSFQDAVNAKLAAPAYSIKHVTIIFLKGWYDFFQEMPRSAWRMCGIAGRMLMELGFHNGEIFRHTFNSEARREEACTLISSIVILDRQWSYATGLPTHFHETSFSSIPTSSVKHPYLKAMLSFILISDRFSEPISKAAKGEGYNDDDAFGLMNFQIDQWRKKAVGDYSLTQCHTWHTNPSSRPPTWTILLNLRAESVRSQLLKPFFFSETDIETTKNHVRSATERVYDIIEVLHILDSTTDIYRKQHPYYQHILACTSGLAFLLIAFIKQNRATVLPSLAPDLVESLGGSFKMAEALTLKYTKRSRSARRLSKRLAEMRINLLSLGILKDSNSGRREDITRGNVQEPLASTARSIRRTSLAQEVTQGLQSHAEYLPPFSDQTISEGFGIITSTGLDTDMGMGWVDSLRLQWPIGDVNHMFSESIF